MVALARRGSKSFASCFSWLQRGAAPSRRAGALARRRRFGWPLSARDRAHATVLIQLFWAKFSLIRCTSTWECKRSRLGPPYVLPWLDPLKRPLFWGHQTTDPSGSESPHPLSTKVEPPRLQIMSYLDASDGSSAKISRGGGFPVVIHASHPGPTSGTPPSFWCRVCTDGTLRPRVPSSVIVHSFSETQEAGGPWHP